MIRGEAVLTAQRLWVNGVPAADIAAAAGCSVGTLYKTAARCGFPRRSRGRGGVLEIATGDPTPDQIAERKAVIRARNEAKRRALR